MTLFAGWWMVAVWLAGMAGSPPMESGWVGATFHPLDDNYIDAYHLPPRGVLVKRVYEDSPAEQVGMMEDDLIYQWGATKIERSGVPAMKELERLLASSAGLTVPVKIMRWKSSEMEELVLALTVKTRPVLRVVKAVEWGLAVQEMDHESADVYDVAPPNWEGVIVTEVVKRGAADLGNVKKGYAITKLGEIPIRSANDFEQAITLFQDLETIPVEYYQMSHCRTAKLRVSLAKLYQPQAKLPKK